MRRAPLLVPAVGVLCGIVADLHGVGAALACLCVVAACYRRDLAIGGIAGLLVAALHGHPPTIEREGRTARYTGTVTSEVRHDDAGGVTFAFRVAGIGTLRAIGRESARAGERLVIRGRIEPLDDPRNPGEPSPRLLALDEGIVGDLSVARIIERAPPDSRDPTIWPALLRERASLIVRSVLPEPAATVLAGALYGERGTLPQSVRDDFQATGTVHVLVTAGLHLGVIAALVCALCGALRIPRVPAALATIPIVYGYAWLSGWHLPAQRAATMIAIALIARACGARSFSLNTLAAAAIVVAACWPVAVESVS
jgi:competence protein ComEC